MTRLAERLRLSLVLTRTITRFLSRVSLSTLRFCKSLLSKTLARLFSSMDNDYLFSSQDDDHLFDLDFQQNTSRQNTSYNQRTNSRDFLDEDDREKVYLVPCRWWKEARTVLADKIEGILYEVSSDNDNADSEIVLDLKKREECQDNRNGDGGVSVREYALVPEGVWLRALKWGK